MEEYPEEVRTPPVGLVAVVGCPEQHLPISSHMQAEQPPINTLALPDFSALSMLLLNPTSTSKKKKKKEDGILKRDWLPKYRTRIPSVVAALFSSDQLSSEWLRVSSLLDNLKSMIRTKNIKLAVVVVLTNGADDDEERMAALRKRAEVDSKYILKFDPRDPSLLEQSLSRLASSLAELSFSYYRDQGRRIKSRVDKKTFNSSDLYVRYCFKVAVYAEFRRDWAEALRFYEDAYHTLREMVGTSARFPPIQHLVQIKTIAEQLHFKICTLLLHGGKLIEAVSWFRQHAASYRRLVGAPQATFLHWEWMSRQFLVFAELLETCSKLIPASSKISLPSPDMPVTEWELEPAYYYQLAANCMKEKQTSLKLAVSISETTGQIDSKAEAVVPSIYVGQFACLLDHENEADAQPLTDEDFIHYAIIEGKRFQDAFEIIALLRRSYESFSNLKAQRMVALCGFQMAVEYFYVDDLGNAKELLDNVASLYRQEGWISLLWEVLGYLRECSRRSGTVKDFVEYSLEMAAIPSSSDAKVSRGNECSPAGPATLARRETILGEVLGLVGSNTCLTSVEDNSCLKFIGDDPLHIEIDLVSPLRLVLLASVAFHEQIIKPGVPALITISLLSQLPLTVDVDQLKVQFNQSECNFTIINSQKSTLPAQSCRQQGHRFESAPSLSLVPNKWLRMTYSIQSGLSGKLECLYIVAKIGSRLVISCRAESPASMDDLPLWKFEDRVETFPTKDPNLAFSGQKAVQVEEADPQVDLILGATGPALVGESFVVPVTVTAKGHDIFSGELKINLVDVRGGGLFSPRESEPFSMDSHHVELLGVVAREGEDESEGGPDDIKKIQQSFGLISIPNLKVAQSWSCNLEIRWYRPKPVMLFVSLGYFPDSNELTSQKVHVQKSLQIEGKSAFLISHRFMLPFRQEPLLLSKIKSVPDTEQPASLPVNLSSILIISAKNCSEVPLQLQSVLIELDKDLEQSCRLQCCNGELSGLAHIVPGEEFKRVFTVMPLAEAKSLKLGPAIIRWRRNLETEVQSSTSVTWVSTKHTLPDVNVELPPLVVHMECPPYASLGDAFTYLVKIKNQTQLLQEIKFSLADAQSFVVSGSQSDTVFILPNAECIVGYKMVPLASGLRVLPRVTVTSLRHSASFQPCASASTVFVFPCRSLFKSIACRKQETETLVAE